MTPIVSDASGFSLPDDQRKVIRWNIYFGFAVLAVGVLFGLGQALNYAGVNIFQYYPGVRTYYEGLTIHGVLNALVLTSVFGNGFMALTTARGLGRPLNGFLLRSSFWTLVIGTVMAACAIVAGKATVLYTFYAPLQAHWTFYLGLTLVVVSTWLTSAALLVALRGWRREHPGERIPLLAFMSIATYVMWDVASVGLAIEVVVLLLPWSLGLVAGSDPMLSRTLFWFTGHPIVYYWLLPVYVSWYGMIPKQAGGALFSDTLTRVAFVMFILLVPVGFHHQFTDPGVGAGLKFAIAFLTFAIFFPSLMTAFGVMYALEIAGRWNGGKGLVGWFLRIRWSDPSVCAQVLAMCAFLFGGISGLMNASYSMNLVVHNTTFIVGHFHLTLATTVALSYMGIAYWMVPYLAQKRLWSPRLAVAQAVSYFAGVAIFAHGLMAGGLEGMPRRTALSIGNYSLPSWHIPGVIGAVGGSIMMASVALFFFILVATILSREEVKIADIPFTETVQPPSQDGWQARLDWFHYWVYASIVIIAIMYGPFVMHHLPPMLSARGFTNY